MSILKITQLLLGSNNQGLYQTRGASRVSLIRCQVREPPESRYTGYDCACVGLEKMALASVFHDTGA